MRFAFEAVLAPWEDYVNHPAFARLGFQSVLRRDALLLRRLGRGEKPEAWLCAACDRPAHCGGPKGRCRGWLRAGRVEVSVAGAHSRRTRRGACALRWAWARTRTMRSRRRSARSCCRRRSAAALPADAGRAVRHDGRGARGRDGGTSRRCCLRPPRRMHRREQLERPALWAHGISGDLPVWCAQPGGAACCGSGHCCARWASACDLALRTGDGGDYLQPTRTERCAERLAALDLAHMSRMRPAACTSCRRTPSQTWRRPLPSVPAWRARAARCRCCPRRATGGINAHRQRRALGRRRHGRPSPDCRRARGATCSRTGASAFSRRTRARGICGIATRTPGASTAGCATRGYCAARRRCA